MPIYDGIEATRRLLARGFAGRVVVLTTFGLDDYVLGALRAGASGFLLKESPAEEILHATHVVAGGDALIAPTVTRAVIDELGRRPVRADLTARLDTLTSREREVLDLQGMRASTRSRDPQSLSGACPTGDSLRAPRTKPLSRETGAGIQPQRTRRFAGAMTGRWNSPSTIQSEQAAGELASTANTYPPGAP